PAAVLAQPLSTQPEPLTSHCSPVTSHTLDITATPGLIFLSLHDALPICAASSGSRDVQATTTAAARNRLGRTTLGRCWRACRPTDRKSTRLNSSHVAISYAVFCLKKKITN